MNQVAAPRAENLCECTGELYTVIYKRHRVTP